MRMNVLYIVAIATILLSLSCSSAPESGEVVTPSEKDRGGTMTDEVTVDGRTLQGRVLGLIQNGIKLSTVYGEGELTIPYETIQRLVSQDSFWILYESENREQEIRGRLFSIEEGNLIVGVEPTTARKIPFESIITGIPEREYDESFWTRLRQKLRYWNARLDTGLTLEEGAVEKEKWLVGASVNRRKKPTRLALDLRYEFEMQQKTDGPQTTTKDELRGLVTGEYDLMPRLFLFAMPAAEWDRPRKILYRTYPAAGVGYRFFESQTAVLQVGVGGAYVYEEFEGFGTNWYAGMYFGIRGEYEFGKGILLDGYLSYIPGIPRADEDWLYRWELNLRVPLYGPLALRLGMTNVGDNNPSVEVGNNKFTTTLGFSLMF